MKLATPTISTPARMRSAKIDERGQHHVTAVRAAVDGNPIGVELWLAADPIE